MATPSARPWLLKALASAICKDPDNPGDTINSWDIALIQAVDATGNN